MNDPELERNFPHPEWDPTRAVEEAVGGLDRLWELGIRTVVDLTVLGLGRDVGLVAEVARRSRVTLLAATGYYTADVLPAYFHTHGPGLLVDGPDPLEAFFLHDIEDGIAGTGVRAAALKVVTDRPGLTPDVRRVMTAAAAVHRRTGVPVFTHTHAASENGREQVAFLEDAGVLARAAGHRPLRRHRGPRLSPVAARPGRDARDGPVRDGARAARRAAGGDRAHPAA